MERIPLGGVGSWVGIPLEGASELPLAGGLEWRWKGS